jgi:hypothetical protein
MATLFFPFGAAFDGNGVPRAGGTISFFQTGTSTPQNTFTDSTLATPNANPVVSDSNGLFPPIYLGAPFDYKAILKDANGVTIATRDPLGFVPAMSLGVVPSYLQGLTLSAAGGTGTFGVAAGTAADSANLTMMTLALAVTKTTAAWAQGSGGGSLDTGVVANSTWYHVHQIQNPTSSLVDIVTSLSATSPTLPTGFTRFRRLGSMLTDGSAHWRAFKQDNDLFQWATLVTDINVNGPTTSALTQTLTVPTGVNVQAWLQISVVNADATACYTYLSDLATTDSTPQQGLSDIGFSNTNVVGAGLKYVRTNTAAQIRTRNSYSSGNVTLLVNTLGWLDPRGKNV